MVNLDSLKMGDKVRVIKSGKVYVLRSIWDSPESRVLNFRQVRANKAGVVGEYGPAFVSLKAENIELVEVAA